ncbi:acyltransferase family protein [Antarctobacter heliothermus]|uniref:Fucose 4-O-acetylase n=1 Tax=Antarctobacter heliothermus TaxID=74033 RepID=A0A239EZL0_9RHOB|nr:acyltransferase [Antarctobacter heliothermus]SNS49264.1 Fucose 4-O-acetylase [Antarctobacter heliothermus]
MIPSPLTRSAPAGRVLWLDRAKGLGIVLVVFGHAWLGAQAAGLLPADRLFHTVEKLIYSFHMPLFFLLSGVTFEASARRRPLLRGARDKALRLLWPLLLWTYVFAAFRYLAGGAVNSPMALADLFTSPLPPQDHLWFLWALFLIQMLGLVIAVPGGRPRPTWVWLALALLAMAVVSLPGLPLGPLTVNAALHLGIFLLGIWLARAGPLPSGMPTRLKALTVFVVVQFISFGLPENILAFQVIAATLSLCFVVMLNARLGVLGRLLVRLGQLSMPIYLAHTLFTAATRIVLFKVTDDPTLHLAFGTLAGLIGPVVLYYTVRAVASPRLLGF